MHEKKHWNKLPIWDLWEYFLVLEQRTPIWLILRLRFRVGYLVEDMESVNISLHVYTKPQIDENVNWGDSLDTSTRVQNNNRKHCKLLRFR